MRIFKCDENQKSYVYSILKILVCVILIIITVNRKRFIQCENLFSDIIIGVVSVLVVVASLLCIYTSVAEMILIHENKEHNKKDMVYSITNSTEYHVNDIVSLLVSNDIIDIEIVLNDGIINIGSASDCHVSDSQFFDKVYYFNDEEFTSLDDFRVKLISISPNGYIKVVAIDGIRHFK